MRRLFSMLAATVVLVAACEPMAPVNDAQPQQDVLLPAVDELTGLDELAGPGRTTEELTFARYREGVSPPTAVVTFDVVPGIASTHVVRYTGLAGDPMLLEFEVGAESLLTLDGSPVLPGVPVPITIMFDPDRFIFYFTPHGLTFSAKDPARLRVNYEGADADMNADGEEDQRERALRHRWRLWQQELPTDPWHQLPTKRLPGDVLEGRIRHFTGFAMAD
jgi:hypothetical protein